MSSIMKGVDQRTQLVGRNRLELLLFRLGESQRFGINVFKVREVIHAPALTRLPHAHPAVRGIARLRGVTLPVVDLAFAIGSKPISDDADEFVVITEFNKRVQGFLVAAVDRIVNLNWEVIHPPPKGVGMDNYLTAVTRVDDELIQVLDVEKVLAEVVGMPTELHRPAGGVDDEIAAYQQARIFVVDDSAIARRQVIGTLEQLGCEYEIACNGEEALEKLEGLADSGIVLAEYFTVVISDIEMPRMDGYTLTKEIKADPRLKDLPVILHTSLSGVFNKSMVERVGAEDFVPKFDPDELAKTVLRYLTPVEPGSAAA